MPPPTDQEEREQTECINLVEPEEELPEDVDVGMDGAPQVWMWTARKDMDLARQLPCLELDYNSKVNEATGLTPFLVFLGREAKLPADMILPNQQEEFEHQGDAVTHCLKNMDKIYDYLKGKEEIRIRRNSMRYSNQPALHKGDIVWYLSSKNVPHKPLKVTKSWTG